MPRSPAPWVDCHVHLQEDDLAPHLIAALAAARQAGVAFWLCCGIHPGDWDRVAELATREPGLLPAFGLHPCFVAAAPPGWRGILADRLRRGAVAVGEIGLDHVVSPRDDALQLQAFRDQLALAREFDLPAVIHGVRAWGTIADTLQADGPPPRGFQLHAFGGPVEMLPRFVSLGAFVSFGGSVLNPAHTRARAALAAVPLDRLLVETDAPALLPPAEFCPEVLLSPTGQPLNTPANLPAIAAGIAALRGLTPAQLAELVHTNARRLLGGSWPSTTPSPAPAS